MKMHAPHNIGIPFAVIYFRETCVYVHKDSDLLQIVYHNEKSETPTFSGCINCSQMLIKKYYTITMNDIDL